MCVHSASLFVGWKASLEPFGARGGFRLISRFDESLLRRAVKACEPMSPRRLGKVP